MSRCLILFFKDGFLVCSSRTVKSFELRFLQTAKYFFFLALEGSKLAKHCRNTATVTMMYAAHFIGNVYFHVSLEVESKFEQVDLTSIISRRARRTTLETSWLTKCRSPSINTGTSTQSLFSTNG